MNVSNITKLINKQLNNNPSITLNNMRDNLVKLQNKLTEAKTQYEGKRSTAEFFSNMMEKINKITEKQKNKKDDDDVDEEEMCSICLNPITGEDVGVTKCGHMYCFQCIKEMIQSNPKCPQCMKPTKPNEIYMISFEDLSRKEQTKDIKDKLSLINKVGTKLANLIFYIKNLKEKCIVFSQWDDLLKKVGDTLDTYGIQNVFCRGNVWSRDKAIRDFTTKDNIKVIMLSSASAAAGTNLTAATKVILLEPISGTYEFRKNTEKQAIGRAHRTGQLEQVTVVRFIIKDTVEEEIYKDNIKEDEKFKNDIEIQMLTDDNLNLTKEEIDKIAKDEEENLKKKEAKPKKKSKNQIDNEKDKKDLDLDLDDSD
jgi:SNF2 family DNA or RNA helicase